MCPDLDFMGVAGELLPIQVSMCLKARIWADRKVTNEFVSQGVPNFSAVDLSWVSGLCERDLRNCTISPPVSDKGAHVFSS